MQFSRRKGRRTYPEVNMIPLIDLFLNILVFFLVTTTFNRDSSFFVDLPEASAEHGKVEQKEVQIGVDANGIIAFGSETVSINELEKKLNAIPYEKRKDLPVVVRADRSSQHGQVVSVIDAARRNGFRNIGIATKTPIGQ